MDDEMPPEPEGLGESDDLSSIDLKPMWMRRLVWDIIPCPDATGMQKRLGLVPSTEEDKEHAESHLRMSRVNWIEPAVQTFSEYVSEVLSTYLVDNATDGVKAQVTDMVLEKLTAQNSEIVRMGALVIVAQLIDTGILGYTEKVLGMSNEQ